jgi:hypothetical protein
VEEAVAHVAVYADAVVSNFILQASSHVILNLYYPLAGATKNPLKKMPSLARLSLYRSREA